MKQISTVGIILSRTNYGEADRIINFLTPDHGKVSGIAKTVRKPKSKLAGGIELFSISEISYIEGRSNIKTITSTRLKEHFNSIQSQLDRTNCGFELLKLINKITEDNADRSYFDLLANSLRALDSLNINYTRVELWFNMHLLWMDGHAPSLASDNNGQALRPDLVYSFDFDSMAFMAFPTGQYNALHIKLLRIAMGKDPATLAVIETDQKVIIQTLTLLKTIRQIVYEV